VPRVADRLLKFLFDRAPVRGEVVQLDAAWQRMIRFHDYPAPVISLLGQMTAAAALLAANIKFNGALTLQIHGDGPVRLLVVECQPDFRLRATAKLQADVSIAADAGLAQLVNLHGRGRCAITLDPRDRLPGQQPYQGIVPLEGESIATALENYMRQSEQLDTRLWLAASSTTAAGILLQKLPREGGTNVACAGEEDDDAWPRATLLASTLTPDELLAVPADGLVQRLFWEEQLQHAPPATPQFACSCSRERIGRMLLSLGRPEVDSILAERGEVEITCDFCNARQTFDAVDVGQLFATGQTVSATSERPH
jgi:molecular chaperone Hsp33